MKWHTKLVTKVGLLNGGASKLMPQGKKLESFSLDLLQAFKLYFAIKSLQFWKDLGPPQRFSSIEIPCLWLKDR